MCDVGTVDTTEDASSSGDINSSRRPPLKRARTYEKPWRLNNLGVKTQCLSFLLGVVAFCGKDRHKI